MLNRFSVAAVQLHEHENNEKGQNKIKTHNFATWVQQNLLKLFRITAKKKIQSCAISTGENYLQNSNRKFWHEETTAIFNLQPRLGIISFLRSNSSTIHTWALLSETVCALNMLSIVSCRRWIIKNDFHAEKKKSYVKHFELPIKAVERKYPNWYLVKNLLQCKT